VGDPDKGRRRELLERAKPGFRTARVPAAPPPTTTAHPCPEQRNPPSSAAPQPRPGAGSRSRPRGPRRTTEPPPATGELPRELEIDTTRDYQPRHPPTPKRQTPEPAQRGSGRPGCLETPHGAPGRIRTCDTRFRRAVLYPLSYGGLRGAYLRKPAHRCSSPAGACWSWRTSGAHTASSMRSASSSSLSGNRCP
jgi:hypothetical protein